MKAHVLKNESQKVLSSNNDNGTDIFHDEEDDIIIAREAPVGNAAIIQKKQKVRRALNITGHYFYKYFVFDQELISLFYLI